MGDGRFYNSGRTGYVLGSHSRSKLLVHYPPIAARPFSGSRLPNRCVVVKVVRFVSHRGVLMLLVLALVLSSARFVAAGLTNAAQVLFSREVMARAQAHSEWAADLFPALTMNTASEPARSMLALALLLDPDNPLARRALYFETMITYSQAGDHNGVIQLYEALSASDLSRPIQRLNDIVALAYLKRAGSWLAMDRYTSARSDLETSLALRPADLYALYHLLEIDTLAGNVQTTPVWHDRLVHFSETGLYFSDARLADLTADAISQLLSEGVWERSMALNSAALLAWREFRSPGTERLLSRLSERYPAEPEWHYLLGEIFQRQGRWADAYAEYRRTLDADPGYDPVWLRLGTVCEALIQLPKAGCTWQMAREYYAAYSAAHPGNVMALKRLLMAEKQLGAATLELEAKLHGVADERLILAEQLDLAPEAISLGRNLLANPGFEILSDSRAAGWRAVAMANYPPFDQALFYTGLDSLDSVEGDQSARVSGVWVGNIPERGSPRAGFWAWNDSKQTLRSIPVERGAVCVLGFYYRTAWIRDRGITVYLNAGTSPSGSFGGEHALPPTEGAWRQVFLLGVISDDSPSSVSPFLRLWGPWQAWFDSVQLRQVMIPSHPMVTLGPKPIVVIR